MGVDSRYLNSMEREMSMSLADAFLTKQHCTFTVRAPKSIFNRCFASFLATMSLDGCAPSSLQSQQLIDEKVNMWHPKIHWVGLRRYF